MVDDLANLDRRHGSDHTARRTRSHPALEEMSERRLNDLLDQRARYQVSERATALAGATVGPLPSR